MTTTHDHQQTTTIPCPTWCTVAHAGGPEFHAGPDLTSGASIHPARIWQDDAIGSVPGIVVGEQLLSAGPAHDLGLELVRAADKLRKAAQAYPRFVGSVTT